MNPIRIGSAISIVCAIVLTTSMDTSVVFAQPCGQWIAKAVSVQGSIQALRAGEKRWQPVKLNDAFCPGDMIRILKLSRADIVLSNDTILRLDQNTTVTFSEPEREKPFLVNLLNGAAYFFSRVRRSLKVFTPFVNAVLEGTEFYVRVESDRAFISIFEGRVLAENQAGGITLVRGQSAVAEANRAPVLQMVVRPRDSVQWTLYYPPVLYFHPSDLQAPTGWQAVVRNSVEFYIEGKVQQAFESLEGVTEEISDPHFFAYRACLLLSVGRVDDARSDIGKALNIAPFDSQALALQSVIAVAQNEKENALSLAKKAVEADPKSASARIALSYAQQANFNLEGAQASLEEAVKLSPENALAWARLSEMWLSFGELKKSLKAAQKAAELNPNLARTQTVLGFAYLMEINIKESKRAFERAIELDQADPMPRLGLGLAKIREGGWPKWEPDFWKMVDKGLLEGTRELEIAASLDPDNSLIRSYLGKAYYEETRDKLATDQFEMAKRLDPADPTPYFYDAIEKQTTNRTVEALYDMQKAIELNDNREVYRSKLLIDADLAARQASQARIYTDLGFQQRGLVEGWKSVNTDPADFSGHRFLADLYSALPRHEIARVSELLQSQLLQPINITPIQPHLAESNLFLISGGGPSDLSFNEFNPLFNRNRVTLQTSFIGGSHNTFGEEVVASGTYDKASFSIGQYYNSTNGFRENASIQDSIFNAFVQYDLFPQTSVQSEFRYRNAKNGDLGLRFFEDDFSPTLRTDDERTSVRLGFHQEFAPGSDLIGNFMYQHENFNTHYSPNNFYIYSGDKAKPDAFSGELQYLFRSRYINFVGGVGYFYIDSEKEFLLLENFPPVVSVPLPTINTNINHTNLYLYSYINPLKNLTFTLGASGDFFTGGATDTNQFNPKFGVTWNPFLDTTLRGAVFRTFKRTLITNQTLEPTQVAGFNQFFDDVNEAETWNYGIAIDQKFFKSLYGGAEFYYRTIKFPYTVLFSGGTPEVNKEKWREDVGRAYAYWTPYKWFGLTAEYWYERMGRGETGTALGVSKVTTNRVPLGINFYHPSGLSAMFKASYVNQNGDFERQYPTSSGVFIHGADNFWLFDAAINYRLPKRYGFITFGVKNLSNRHFNFFDTAVGFGLENPTIQPSRFIFGKITLALP